MMKAFQIGRQCRTSIHRLGSERTHVLQVRCNAVAELSLIERLLDREWLIDSPEAEVTAVRTPEGHAFRVVRDDLAHPYVSGNKRRKLDGLWPQLVNSGITDVVTCGGTQSAHVLAVAAAAAEHGMRAHLLVRGEPPAMPTGNHLFARMLAHRFCYVSRSDYADRTAMLLRYAQQLELKQGPEAMARVALVPEGGAEAAALLGMVRLIRWLADSGTVERDQPCTLVIDSGTGTSGVGLALGAALMRLPWRVIGVMLVGPVDYYEQQAAALVGSFCEGEGVPDAEAVALEVGSRLQWVDRRVPRKFGQVRAGEIERCAALAAAHGIVLDPMWTLAAWEVAADMAGSTEREVVMVHSGGTLGLCGLAQRFPQQF